MRQALDHHATCVPGPGDYNRKPSREEIIAALQHFTTCRQTERDYSNREDMKIILAEMFRQFGIVMSQYKAYLKMYTTWYIVGT